MSYNMPRDDSPRGSPRGSVGSNEGDLSFENHDVDNDRFSTRDFGDVESKISADIENYNELDQNPIFRQLCPKNKFEDKPTCKVCSKSFKFMTKKKNCKFCGGCICEEHGKKKRPNPTNTTEYVRICDICDELHIQKTILSEFKEKLDKKLEALEKYQREINEQQFKINDGQKELDDLTLKKARNDKNYSEQMTFLTNDIAKGKEETRKCEKDNAEMTKELQKTQKKVEELDAELVQTEQEFEKLSKEGVELTNQIEALNLDIAQMSKTIRNMEEVASQNKALQAAAEAKAMATANKNRATSDENIVIPSVKSVETVKNVETPSKDESTVISPSPSENRTSISRVVEPEELAPEKSEAKSSMIENQSKRSMAKSSMSQGVPRMVKTSMIRNKGEAPVKEKNCNVECNLF